MPQAILNQFHDIFSPGTILWEDRKPGSWLVIAGDQDNAFKRLAEKYKNHFPGMPATVPVHQKYVRYYEDAVWGFTEEKTEFMVWAVDPFYRNEK